MDLPTNEINQNVRKNLEALKQSYTSGVTTTLILVIIFLLSFYLSFKGYIPYKILIICMSGYYIYDFAQFMIS